MVANVKYKKALRYYDWMMNLKDLIDKPDKSFENQKVVLLLNLTAVKLKQRKFKEALILCNKVRNYFFLITTSKQNQLKKCPSLQIGFSNK